MGAARKNDGRLFLKVKRRMGRQGRKSSYNERYAAMVLEFVQCPDSIMVCGKFSDTKLAAVLGINRETIRQWKTPVPGRESLYQPKFAEACAACQANVDLGLSKIGVVEGSRKHTLKKTIKVLNIKTNKMQKVREEIQEKMPDPALVKIAFNNLQKHLPEDQRWDTSDKVKQTHEVGASLAEFLKDFA